MRRPIQHATLLAGALTLFASPARADIVPSGYKPVKLSIEVSGAAAKGHTLLLLNTFKGATKLAPGHVVEVDWHPLHGKMQLVSATAAQVTAIERIAEEDRGEERMPKMQAQSSPCAEPFDGVRTVKDTETYDEIRWHYAVTYEGDSCDGKLTRTTYLAEGEDVKAPPTATTTPETKPADASTENAPSSSSPPARSASSCATRETPESHGFGAWLSLAGLVLALRLRSRTSA